MNNNNELKRPNKLCNTSNTMKFLMFFRREFINYLDIRYLLFVHAANRRHLRQNNVLLILLSITDPSSQTKCRIQSLLVGNGIICPDKCSLFVAKRADYKAISLRSAEQLSPKRRLPDCSESHKARIYYSKYFISH